MRGFLFFIGHLFHPICSLVNSALYYQCVHTIHKRIYYQWVMFNYKKTVQMINFFATKAEEEELSLYKTNTLKLLYFADKKHLRDYLRTISGDTYTAKQMGPVADNACDLIEAQASGEEKKAEDVKYANEYVTSTKKIFSRNTAITTKKEVDKKYLSETDLYVLNYVWDTYKDLIQKNLWKETHKYPEGAKFERSHQWQKIQEKEMISTTLDNENDLLGNISEEDLENTRNIYAEMSSAKEALHT